METSTKTSRNQSTCHNLLANVQWITLILGNQYRIHEKGPANEKYAKKKVIADWVFRRSRGKETHIHWALPMYWVGHQLSTSTYMEQFSRNIGIFLHVDGWGYWSLKN